MRQIFQKILGLLSGVSKDELKDRLGERIRLLQYQRINDKSLINIIYPSYVVQVNGYFGEVVSKKGYIYFVVSFFDGTTRTFKTKDEFNDVPGYIKVQIWMGKLIGKDVLDNWDNLSKRDIKKILKKSDRIITKTINNAETRKDY